MKKIITILLTLSLFSMLASSSNSQTLYGSAYDGEDGPSTLYTIDINTGQATAIGPIGFERCNALEFDTTTETLFALCERTDGSDEAVLVNIDPATGVGNEVGPTNNCGLWTDMSFRNSDNELFAIGFAGCGNSSLGNINTTTGSSNIITNVTGINGCCGLAIAFSLSDTLFYLLSDSPGPVGNLYSVNLITGMGNLVTGINFPALLDDTPRINAMDFNPTTGDLFASIVNGGRQFFGPRQNFIGIVNTATGNLSVIGPTVEGMDAIAFSSAPPPPPAQVPTISEWGIIALAGILGIVGFMVIRKRKATA